MERAFACKASDGSVIAANVMVSSVPFRVAIAFPCPNSNSVFSYDVHLSSILTYIQDYWQSLAPNTDTFASISTAAATGPSASIQTEMSPARAQYHNRHERPSVQHDNGHHREDGGMPLGMSTLTAALRDQQLHPHSSAPPIPNPSDPREPVYPLGSREDVQHEDYVSPLTGMFGRAYGRYQEAEAARMAARAHGFEAISSWNNQGQFTTVYRPSLNPLLDPTAARADQTQANQAQTQEDLNAFFNHTRNLRRTQRAVSAEDGQSARSVDDITTQRRLGMEYTQTPLDPTAAGFVPQDLPATPILRAHSRRQRLGFHRQFYTDSFHTFGNVPRTNPFEIDDNSINPIDAQSSRPSPFRSEDLKVDLACKICTEQKINTVCMPCMHACMCRWCAAIHKNDCRDYDTGRWNGALWKCPICRKSIQEVKRLFI